MLMNWIDPYNLVLFDFDGLLVNSEQLHYEAYKQMCARRGFTMAWGFHHYADIAHSSPEALYKALQEEFPGLCEEGGWPACYEEKQHIYQELISDGKMGLMPGVEILLEYLAKKDVSRCVVTNSRRVQVEAISQAIPALRTIPHFLTREDYSARKPAPDGYLLAIERYGNDASRIIGFEDTLIGVQSLSATKRALPVLICEPRASKQAKALFPNLLHYKSFLDIGDQLGS